MGYSQRMEEALAFLRAAAEAECLARRATILERDDKKLVKLIREWDAMFAGLRSGLSRPSGLPTKFFEAQSQLDKAKRTKPPTVFAVARYKAGKSDLYRGWMGDSETRPRGEALLDSLFVRKVDGELKIVSHYTRCSTCLGAMKLDNGKKCPDCKATGWQHRAGAEFEKLGSPEEVRKLAEPTDPVSKPLYDAIEATE